MREQQPKSRTPFPPSERSLGTQGSPRGHSGEIQRTSRGHAEVTQGKFREHPEVTQRSFREHPGVTQGSFRGHSENIQGSPRGHSEDKSRDRQAAATREERLTGCAKAEDIYKYSTITQTQTHPPIHPSIHVIVLEVLMYFSLSSRSQDLRIYFIITMFIIILECFI